jgi:hypothetical protein
MLQDGVVCNQKQEQTNVNVTGYNLKHISRTENLVNQTNMKGAPQ